MVYAKHLSLGKLGEEAAAGLLEKNGYKILFRNYRTKLGEVDIIARDRDTLCFVEVKTRRSDSYGLPQEAVSPKKQRQIAKAALLFLKENNLFKQKARFDVVSAVYCPQDDDLKTDLFKNAFDLDQRFTF